MSEPEPSTFDKITRGIILIGSIGIVIYFIILAMIKLSNANNKETMRSYIESPDEHNADDIYHNSMQRYDNIRLNEGISGEMEERLFGQKIGTRTPVKLMPDAQQGKFVKNWTHRRYLGCYEDDGVFPINIGEDNPRNCSTMALNRGYRVSALKHNAHNSVSCLTGNEFTYGVNGKSEDCHQNADLWIGGKNSVAVYST
jgi:hypothetical protein